MYTYVDILEKKKKVKFIFIFCIVYFVCFLSNEKLGRRKCQCHHHVTMLFLPWLSSGGVDQSSSNTPDPCHTLTSKLICSSPLYGSWQPVWRHITTPYYDKVRTEIQKLIKIVILVILGVTGNLPIWLFKYEDMLTTSSVSFIYWCLDEKRWRAVQLTLK